MLTDTFSSKLDRDLIGAAGPMPIPTGILSVAAVADGADLELAAIAAKASIATAGGQASHIVLNPVHVGGLEAARDDLGRRLYDDPATRFAGLQTVQAVGATQPFVFDRGRVWLVVNRDFTVDISRETDSAWKPLRPVDPRSGQVCPGGAAAQQGGPQAHRGGGRADRAAAR